MKIEGTTNNMMIGHSGERKGRDKTMEGHNSPLLSAKNIQDMAAAEPAAAAEQQPVPGVIRNLQEGHFKGMASVRLQINFQERLQSEAAGRANEALAASSTSMVSYMEERVFAIGGEFSSDSDGSEMFDRIGEMFSTFSSAIGSLFGGESDTQARPTSLLTGIRDAFDSFFADFSSLGDMPVIAAAKETNLAADPAEELVDTVLAADEEETIPAIIAQSDTADDSVIGEEPTMLPTFADRLEELRSWFDETFSVMQAQVDQLMELPPLGEPRGNGRAYSRFVAVYREMYGEVNSPAASNDNEDSGITTTA